MDAHVSTSVVHAGEERRKPYAALTTPIVQSSTFTFADTSEIRDYMRAKDNNDPQAREEYARYSNPTQTVAERKLAALEGGERGVLFASGMCAITTTLLALLSRGDHAVVVRPCYRRTVDFGREHLPRLGIETDFIAVDQIDSLEAVLRPNTRVVFAETPTNPHLRILDLKHVASICRAHDAISVVDSTFATPINLRPIEHGVDLVIHSASKYLGGHNDLLAGAVIGEERLIHRIAQLRGVLGGVISPHTAYLLLRGLKTLVLRVDRQNRSGMEIARFLEGHPAVRCVHYPGLRSHPDHSAALRTLSGFGGVVSFEIAGDVNDASRFVDRLELPFIGPTLGGVESIAEQQSLFVSLDPEERSGSGIAGNLVRLAIGIEDPRDLIADLDQALSALASARQGAA